MENLDFFEILAFLEIRKARALRLTRKGHGPSPGGGASIHVCIYIYLSIYIYTGFAPVTQIQSGLGILLFVFRFRNSVEHAMAFKAKKLGFGSRAHGQTHGPPFGFENFEFRKYLGKSLLALALSPTSIWGKHFGSS